MPSEVEASLDPSSAVVRNIDAGSAGEKGDPSTSLGMTIEGNLIVGASKADPIRQVYPIPPIHQEVLRPVLRKIGDAPGGKGALGVRGSQRRDLLLKGRRDGPETNAAAPEFRWALSSLDAAARHGYIGYMNHANISYTRNHLSELIARVREGETIVILDRQQPVARLEPLAGPLAKESGWHGDLVRRGLIRPASAAVDVKALRSLPLPKPRGDVLGALLAEREEGP